MQAVLFTACVATKLWRSGKGLANRCCKAPEWPLAQSVSQSVSQPASKSLSQSLSQSVSQSLSPLDNSSSIPEAPASPDLALGLCVHLGVDGAVEGPAERLGVGKNPVHPGTQAWGSQITGLNS